MTLPKNEDEKQTARFGFTCTEAEAKEIRALAKAHGISQHSVFIRLACLGIIPVDRSKIAVEGASPQETPTTETSDMVVKPKKTGAFKM